MTTTGAVSPGSRCSASPRRALELPPVGQAGERVGEGEVLRAVLGLLPSLDLAALVEEPPDAESDQADRGEEHHDDDLVDLLVLMRARVFVEPLEPLQVAGDPVEGHQCSEDQTDVDDRRVGNPGRPMRRDRRSKSRHGGPRLAAFASTSKPYAH